MIRLLIIVAVLLQGCATPPKPDRGVELALVEAKTACYNSISAVKTNDEKLVDPKDILLGKAIDALAKAVNKATDVCASIVTNNDLQKVAMEENTKQIVAGVDFAKSAAGNIVVGVGVWKGLDVLPDLFASAGAKTTISSAGAMALTDSVNTSTMGAVSGASSIGGVLNKPITSTTTLEFLGQ